MRRAAEEIKNQPIFEKDKKALLRLKKKADDFNRKISESLSEYD